MTQSTEQERAEFEAVASDNGKWPQAVERDAKGNYLLLTTANGWMWWQAARRAQVVPQSEPVAYLWQHGETGRTRVVMPDTVITADANWIVVGPLYLAAAPQPPEACTCPSGDGSLRWPCPQHPPEEDSNPAEFDGIKTNAAPVQMPEPVGVAHSGQLDNVKDGYAYVYPVGSVGADCKLYTEHQVRELLARK